jgi:protein-S-isoprenylcysteine O-methyltransferase Ste14
MHLHEIAKGKCLVSLNWLRFLDLGSYLILAVVAGKYWHSDRHHWLGAAISVPAFFLWMLARQQIGASFAVRAEAKKLVTHGLYSKIRHPIYIFGGLAFLGEFLALGWYIWMVVFLLINFSQYLRVRREEQVLSEAFGDEYRGYKARTWF